VPQESVWKELAGAGLALHSELALDAVLQTLVQRAATLVGAKHAAVGVLDRSVTGFEQTVGHAELLAEPAAASQLDVPVVIRGVPYARLVVAARPDGARFSSQDEEIVSALVDQAAVAIENVRRYESAMRHLAQLKALDETANDLARELDLPRLLVGVAERLRELLSASSVLFFLPTADGNDLEIRAAAGEQRKWLGSRLPRKGSITGRVFERARSERTDMAIEDPDVYQPLARPMNTRTALFVPLLGDDGAIGVIVATNKLGHDETFSEDDLRLAETFAARCVVAVRLSAHGGLSGPPPERDAGSDVERAGLTGREVEVLRLVAHGMSDAQVAARLVVSQRTVHAHLRSIYRKLGVESRGAATRWAADHRVA
jgi:DNA-binding NarL/FixJ family response regulator